VGLLLLLLLPVGWPRHKGLRSAPWSLTRSRAAVSKTRGSSPSVVVQPLERKENHHDFMAQEQELVCCGHIQNLHGPFELKPRTHQKQARAAVRVAFPTNMSELRSDSRSSRTTMEPILIG
jgi:hypothetical protein